MATKAELRAQLADAIIGRDFDQVQALADQMTAIDRAEGSGYRRIAVEHRARWQQQVRCSRGGAG